MAKRKYVYFFTRQDISPEQQVVQTAHVALKLGCVFGADIKPDETYFTVVGVRNQEALLAAMRILIAFEFPFTDFVEPDMGGELTSIATTPIDEDKRGPLLAFNLLTIKHR